MIERFFQTQTKPIVLAYLIPFLIASFVDISALTWNISSSHLYMCQRSLKHNFGSLSGLSGHLSADASIIVDLTFEKAAIQIVNASTSSECQCPWCSWHAWRHSSPSGGWVLLPPEDQNQCKRRTTSNDNIASQYSSLDVLSNMSVSCEGLCSAEEQHKTVDFMSGVWSTG